MFPASWPSCREPFICKASSFPILPTYASSSGLVCPAANVLEFNSANCSCPDGKTSDSNVLPRCSQGGVWTSPSTWPVCVEMSTTAGLSTTVSGSTLTGSVGSATTGTTQAGTGSTVSTTVTSTSASSIAPGRRKRNALEFMYDSQKKSYVSISEYKARREKRQASLTPNYVEVMMEIQFAAKANATGIKLTDLTTVLRNITTTAKGALRPDKLDPLYQAMEVPPVGYETCRDCILVQSKTFFVNRFINDFSGTFSIIS